MLARCPNVAARYSYACQKKIPCVQVFVKHGTRLFCRAHAASPSSQVAVVGGGAAGLTAAYFAAMVLGKGKVTVLERTREAGKKVLMSGGARCNILPYEVDVDRDFMTDSPRSALRAVFSSWGVWECWSWLCEADHVGLELALEEESNKWFPVSNSSKDVRNKLVAACERLGVRFQYNADVCDLEPVCQTHGTADSGEDEASQGWAIHLADGRRHTCSNVVLATGGLSFPMVGTDGTGHDLIRKLGHKLVEPFPALTPLTGPHPGPESISGVSLDVAASVRIGKRTVPAHRAGFLFTHKGYSGPAVLDLSHHLIRSLDNQGATGSQTSGQRPRLAVRWSDLSVSDWEAELHAPGNGAAAVSTVVRRHLPKRLAASLVGGVVDPQKPCGSLTKGEAAKLTERLAAYQLPVSGHQGYKKAEVTGGGVRLQDIDCKTMQSRLRPGIFLCGEICDVFGRIGGFNFYWAWVSGRAAGLGAAGTDWTHSAV
eukprot:jgi/Ulvmu1/12694/UM094_0053.1